MKIENITYIYNKMGIKGFSKTFEPTPIKLKDLKDCNLAIDASILLYKAALGAKSINTLTRDDLVLL